MISESKIIKMYSEEHKSTYEIAEHFSTYPNKVRRILKKNGVPLKSHSQAQKEALTQGRAKHPTDGRKRTKDERLKISSSVYNYWENMSDDERSRRVEDARTRWNDMPQVKKDQMCSMAMAAIQLAGKEGSKLEKFLEQNLRKQGHRVEFHKKNLIPTQKLEIDMYLPDLKTIIEIDGPSHFLPIWGEDKLAKQIKADSQKSGIILSRGFLIIRVKNVADFMSLRIQEKLIHEVSTELAKIKKKFPKKEERYIEIEL